MSDYTFETLNDKDFEILVVELLSRKFNTSIERFKSGKDQGIDGRFTEGNLNNQTVIIQCKHWLKTGITKLIKECEKTEFDKVKTLNPNRYIFVTSLPLSAKNKEAIFNIFSPYIKTESDVIGQEDLNELLKAYPEIERNNYKLYLTSTNILQSILANDVIGRSNFYLEDIRDFVSKYVRTINHKQAFETLERTGSVIVNGEPGIGKTTLAKQLCLDYICLDYELVVISSSMSEAEQLFTKGKKQVFYFDDFLGSNFLSALEGNQDSDIVNFIKRVRKDSTKRFILTTRSNILNQGKSLSEKFYQNNIEQNEYEIKISSLNKFDKARILYNHIYFSNLSEAFIDEIYKDERYMQIINHKNYNPRLIEFITDSFKVENLTNSEGYWNYIQQSLNNPKDIWRSMIENQLSSLDKHIITAITINDGLIKEEQLSSFLLRATEAGFDNTSDFPTIDSISRRLTGSVLNRNIIKDGSIEYTLFNPSIADFIIHEYTSRTDYISKLISFLRLEYTLSNIKKLYLSANLSSNYVEVIKNLVDTEISSNIEPDSYTTRLIELADDLCLDTQPIIMKLMTIDLDELLQEFGLVTLKILQIAIDLGLYSNFQKASLIINKTLYDPDADDFKYIYDLISVIPNNTMLITQYRKAVVNLFSEAITDWALEDNKFDHLFDTEVVFDDEAYTYVDELLEEFECDTDITQEDRNAIAHSIDFSRIILSNLDNEGYAEARAEEFRESQYDSIGSHTSSIVDPISDLFQRE